MKVRWIAILLLIGTAVVLSPVSAQQIDNDNDGYIVAPVKDSHPQWMAPMSYGIITQGETDLYTKSVSSGTTSLIADLNWGDTTDSLSLTIIAPDATLGPYYDVADGIVDGRIYLKISRSSGLTPGTWTFRVYGDEVTGYEDYNFYAY